MELRHCQLDHRSVERICEAPSPRSYVWVTANGPGRLAQCAGGDSGGNVYSGGTAYGVLSACYGTKSIFMAIRYINGDNMVVTYH